MFFIHRHLTIAGYFLAVSIGSISCEARRLSIYIFTFSSQMWCNFLVEVRLIDNYLNNYSAIITELLKTIWVSGLLSDLWPSILFAMTYINVFELTFHVSIAELKWQWELKDSWKFEVKMRCRKIEKCWMLRYIISPSTWAAEAEAMCLGRIVKPRKAYAGTPPVSCNEDDDLSNYSNMVRTHGWVPEVQRLRYTSALCMLDDAHIEDNWSDVRQYMWPDHCRLVVDDKSAFAHVGQPGGTPPPQRHIVHGIGLKIEESDDSVTEHLLEICIVTGHSSYTQQPSWATCNRQK